MNAIIVVAVLVAGGGIACAQQSGLSRTDLQRHDLSVAGWETVQVRVDFAPGAVAARHFHPGEEIIYILEGTLQYEIQDKAPTTLNTGDVLFIPARTVHSAKNIGIGKASELATYVVEKGQPLVTLVK